MSDEVTFRLAEPEDAEKVLQLLNTLQQESDTFLVDSDLSEITVEMEAQQIKLINQSCSNLMALAVNDDQLLGIVTVDRINDETGELGVAVLKAFQGVTLGSNLVELAVDWAITYSLLTTLELTVVATNEPAVHIYKKIGFENVMQFLEHDRQVFKMTLDVSGK
ncbi:GNAT family N-acetyltransferase [Lentilactobacillus kisonensis]|uniref:Acetyltransferase, GNAT family n=2 Tax=Lentilactobacillus kisonensis TaxID=481722 RepID=H1LC17_9LACO|nr:GNAT family N-acetyltransferase [Lentilactobacillus kisonensis]EHO54489.1 acetyltransferase, GNAT family [Lentilactobacillus kisonensis F0435]KRL21174.1 acetyltransferase, GNAT family [Lentilactobacillus kisonensis DSM 19906 = JCM 15041]